MSLFPIKDLNFLLSEYLDDLDVLQLSHINRYYYDLYNNLFWKKRFLNRYRNLIYHIEDKYINYYKEPWKEYYFHTFFFLNIENYVVSSHCAIREDRVDLLSLILVKYKPNIHELFVSSIRHTNFVPLTLAVEYDSINCYKILDLNVREQDFESMIRFKSDKILRYVYERSKCDYDISFIMYCLMYDSPALIQLMTEHNTLDVENAIEGILGAKFPQKFPQNNSAFKQFLKHPYFTHENLFKFKTKALYRNNLDLLSLINRYTSYFNHI